MSDYNQEGNNGGTTISYNQSGVQQFAEAPERKQTVTYVDNVNVSNRYVNNEYARPAQQIPKTPIPAQQPEVPQQAAPVQQPAAPQQAAPVQPQAAPQQAAPVQPQAAPQSVAPTQQQAVPVQPQAAPQQATSVQPQTAPMQHKATPYEASPIQARVQPQAAAPQASPVQPQTAPQQAQAVNTREVPKEKKEKKKPPFILRLLAAAAFGLVFGLVAGGVILLMINLIPNKLTNQTPPSTSVIASEPVSTEPVSAEPVSSESGVLTGEGSGALSVTEVTGDMTVPEVASECMPSIVIINTKLDYNYYGYVQEVSASGTGVIVGINDEDLFIATNYHVVENAKEITIQFCDSSTANAEVKGKKVSTDLAVVTVKLSSLGEDTKKTVKLARVGDSDALVVGESVVAIGNALGYGQSVTVGVVSALNREVTTEKGEKGVFIQTDAAINHGNSGGALLNMRGELIGINSNKLDGSSVESMGYAIPVNTARPIIEDLIAKKPLEELPENEQSYFGISGATVKSGAYTQSGQLIPAGIYVTGVVAGSPADVAGIQRGDIITEFDGDSVVSIGELQTYLASYPSGAEVTITYKRLENGVFVVHDTKVTLQGKSTTGATRP